MKLRKGIKMPTASKVFSQNGWCNVCDPAGVVDGVCLLFSLNLVCLRDMKKLKIEA